MTTIGAHRPIGAWIGTKISLALCRFICVPAIIKWIPVAINTALLLGSASAAYAMEIKVMSDTLFVVAMERIGEKFRESTGNDVKFVFGPSPEIKKR
jgi:ABC-type molybdate transport system substrate-binding protein